MRFNQTDASTRLFLLVYVSPLASVCVTVRACSCVRACVRVRASIFNTNQYDSQDILHLPPNVKDRAAEEENISRIGLSFFNSASLSLSLSCVCVCVFVIFGISLEILSKFI